MNKIKIIQLDPSDAYVRHESVKNTIEGQEFIVHDTDPHGIFHCPCYEFSDKAAFNTFKEAYLNVHPDDERINRLVLIEDRMVFKYLD
jgi:hypothetical protein